MKLSYFLILLFLEPVSAWEPVLELPRMVTIDVKLGKTATKIIRFKNNGLSDLLLHEVSSDCSCTVADFTKTVKPHSEGEISIKYNSSGKRKGTTTQMLVIKSNTPQKFSKLIVKLNIL